MASRRGRDSWLKAHGLWLVRSFLSHAPLALSLALFATACASAPVVTPPQVPKLTWEQKLTWMMRLEDQRLVRDPNPPPPSVIQAATARQPAVVGPLPPSDLIRLLQDPEARVRRRAALALGRVGLAEAVQALSMLFADQEPEVRQMAVFSLGLIGDPAARPMLLGALGSADVLVRGRAAEALGQIGDRTDAEAIGRMVQAFVATRLLASVDPDDLTYPLAAEIEAVRLGIFALARLGSYEALAAAVLDQAGQPVSRWWPVAYALQRVGDARAAPALLTLMTTPGRYTASFAVRGLAATKAAQAIPGLRQIVDQRSAPQAVVIQALRALASLGDSGATGLLTKLVANASLEPSIRLEAMTTLGAVAGAGASELLVDLISDPAPGIRGPAMRALARVDRDTFMATLSGLDPDRDWTVRVAQAGALGDLPAEQGVPRLMIMLGDQDQRVVPAVIAALVASKASDAERLIVARLKAEDFVVRSAAARALADLKAVGALPALREAYVAAAGDRTYVARAAILGAINTISPPYGRQLLDGALKDPDWAMRVRAADLLRQQGVTTAVEAIRPSTAGRPVDDPEWRALATPEFSPHAFLETDKGTIEIELAVLDAPMTVNNFVTLARKGFFNGVQIHRVVYDFVVQDGDPRGDGEGGPGYTIRDELNQRPYLRGTVGMALDWKDTGGSQFFITHSPQPHLDARYTVFGHVVNGMDVVDRIVPWDVVRRVRIWDGVSPQ